MHLPLLALSELALKSSALLLVGYGGAALLSRGSAAQRSRAGRLLELPVYPPR